MAALRERAPFCVARIRRSTPSGVTLDKASPPANPWGILPGAQVTAWSASCQVVHARFRSKGEWMCNAGLQEFEPRIVKDLRVAARGEGVPEDRGNTPKWTGPGRLQP